MPGAHLNHTERRLLNWWKNSNDFPYPVLKQISIKGKPGLRGIKDLSIEFKYPLTVICGKNGVGKTTILALAALAYHSSEGHYPINALRKPREGENFTYYTFKDFFFKGPNDPDITGIEIFWRYWDGRKEKILKIVKQSKKWMHYERRPKRPVHYLGMIRAVPAQEYKIIRSRFGASKKIKKKDFDSDYLVLFKNVMSQSYTNATTLSTKDVSIRSVNSGNDEYTSFNMGAGEDAALYILDVISKTPDGALIVVDEIEIGLHPEAQIRLAEVLQEVILRKKLQIIVSTHSEYFIDAVPRIARVLIQKGGSHHNPIHEPTTRLAIGTMKGSQEPELIIYCEDGVAEILIRQALDFTIRKRVKIVPVGSDSELINQAIAHIRAGFRERLIIVWDGDVKNKKGDLKRWIKKIDDNQIDPTKINITFMPGDQKPEDWILNQLDKEEVVKLLKSELQCNEEAEVRELITQLKSLSNSKDIFFEFSKHYGSDIYESKQILAKSIVGQSEKPLGEIVEDIRSVLNDGNVRRDKELLEGT